MSPEVIGAAIRRRIALVLKRRKVSQSEAARRLHCVPGMVSRWSNPSADGKVPGGVHLARFCKEFDVDANWMLTGRGAWELHSNADERVEKMVDLVDRLERPAARSGGNKPARRVRRAAARGAPD